MTHFWPHDRLFFDRPYYQTLVVCQFDVNFPHFFDIYIASEISIYKTDLRLTYLQWRFNRFIKRHGRKRIGGAEFCSFQLLQPGERGTGYDSAVATVEATEAAASVKILTFWNFDAVLRRFDTGNRRIGHLFESPDTVADTMDETDEIDDVGGSSYTDDDEEDILNELLSTSLSQLM